MTLERLALSRSTIDRAAHLRIDPGLLARLLHDPATAVLVLDGERTLVTDLPALPRLVLLEPPAARRLRALDETVVTAFLGQDVAGRGYVLLAFRSLPSVPEPSAGAQPVVDGAPPGARWAGLREVGARFSDTDAGLLTAAVALANWHAAHARCARCGEPTTLIQAGWARQCPACGAEHYPRTDPAVIMAVVDDDDDRILLGRQASWPEKRFSTLAGFVEPGESLEAAVRREVFEEAGIVVGEVAYRGSQPWPFPSSIMLGFRARATTIDVTVDGEELAQARWWSREELALDLATGELLLPPGVSIARRLIEDWYGVPITDAGEAWR